MTDGRSNRKFKVIPFINRVERDRKENLTHLVYRAKIMRLEGFESVIWTDSVWQIFAGRLIEQSGKHVKSASFKFSLSPKLGGELFIGNWAEVAKSLFILRFHRKHQSTPNQHNFITAIGYVAFAAKQLAQDLTNITRETLDNACALVSTHYSESTAYNIHKHVAEFSAHCDANGLCRVLLQYKYINMTRPDISGGLNYKRLDDPSVLETKSNKLIAPDVYRIIGELYLKVPSKHKYRLYVLMLTFLACTGRRFSEVSLLPNQQLSFDAEGNAYIEYFPRKASRGKVFTPKRRLFLSSEMSSIVGDLLVEVSELTSDARITAEEMLRVGGPDIRFLQKIPDDKKIYTNELVKLGISDTVLATTGWLRKKKFAWPDNNAFTKTGRSPLYPVYYTYKSEIIKYCCRDFSDTYLLAIHTDQFGNKYYIKDLLFIRSLGISSGYYAHWLAASCSQSMFTTFLRYLPRLAAKYTSSNIDVDFTSHHFRHTLNTLLDEGGLSDLLQTSWFGRTNSRDTRAYQHTSREKRVLMLREEIKKGLVGGQLAEQIKVVSVEVQDAILKARIHAVHDVGTGICIHNFSQSPCERHLQCSANCKDYVWIKDDKERLDEQKRQYALTLLARQNAENHLNSKNPKKSADWLAHNEKKIKTLAAQLADNGVEHFDPEQYFNEVGHDETL